MRDYEASHEPAGHKPAPQERDDERRLRMMFGESRHGQQPIEPAACLRRLKRAASLEDGELMEFELTDLMDGLEERREGAPQTVVVGAHESLRLLVSPSNVRAVKLVERN